MLVAELKTSLQVVCLNLDGLGIGRIVLSEQLNIFRITLLKHLPPMF